MDEDGGDHRGVRRFSTGWRRCLLRRYGHARPDALLPLHDDALARLQALLDDGKAVAALPELYPALLDFIVLANDEHVRTGLVDGDS